MPPGAANLDEVQLVLRTFINDYFLLGRVDGPVSDNDLLTDRGIIDGSGMRVLAVFIENKFGVRMEEDDITAENLASIKRISNFIARKHRST